MKKIEPRRVMNTPSARFGFLGATVLLAACVVLPDELFGYRTIYLLSGIFIIGFSLLAAGYFLWIIARTVFSKNQIPRDGRSTRRRKI